MRDHAPAERPDAAAPPRRPVLFVNPRSGGGRASRTRISERARERGLEVVELTPDRNLATMVDEALAAGADALGVAGGDGSLGLVAAAAFANRLPLVCIPAGTRNHFARDLGLDPDDPAAALNAFSDRVEDRIDVGEVNGRPFLNVVSLGIYGESVRRSAYRDAKLSTLLETARAVLGPGGETPELALVDDMGGEHSHPAIVLVSNNPYALGRPVAHGARPTLARRATRNHRHRRARRRPASVGQSVDRDAPGGGCPGDGARRSRWRGGRVQPATEVCDPAAGVAGLDAAACRRSAAATPTGARAAPTTAPAMTSPG